MNESTLPTMLEWQSERWLMRPEALANMLGSLKAAEVAGLQAEQQTGGSGTTSGRPGVRIEGSTAFVQIAGYLMRTVPKWVDWFRSRMGLALTGYDEIIEDINEVAADEAVEQIVLQVDSPGGMASGVTAAAEAIAAARRIKPVTAMIADLGASAAYLLASQAGNIVAEPEAIVGSIGTVVVMRDVSAAFEAAGIRTIVVSNGEHKGTGAAGTEITDEQLEPFQKIVDGLTTQFVNSVASGRGMSVAEVRKLADGRIWVAPDAKDLGLIDEVGLSATTNDTALAEGRSAGDTTKQEIEIMADEKTGETPAADQVKTARDEGQTAGQEAAQQRFALLQAAFPKEPAFVGEQFAAGHDVTQAKAAFSDVLTERNATLQADNAKLQQAAETTATAEQKAAAEASKGAAPIGSKAEGGNEAEGGFMEAARALAAEEKIPVSAAQSQIAREQPELHEAFMAGLKPLKKTG